MFKTRNIAVLIGAVIFAGLVLGAMLGGLSRPEMIYRGEALGGPPAAGSQIAEPIEDRDLGRDMAFSGYSYRPDLDYESEVWPEDPEYTFDPGFAAEEEEEFLREMRRAYPGYGRQSSRLDPSRKGDAELTWPEREAGDRLPALRNPVDPTPSDRYRNSADSARQDPGSARSVDPSAPPPSREPRAADGQLPAIW